MIVQKSTWILLQLLAEFVKCKTGSVRLTVRGGGNEGPYIKLFSEFEVQTPKELDRILAVRKLIAFDCGDVA